MMIKADTFFTLYPLGPEASDTIISTGGCA
jgi:hypothetical protein